MGNREFERQPVMAEMIQKVGRMGTADEVAAVVAFLVSGDVLLHDRIRRPRRRGRGCDDQLDVRAVIQRAEQLTPRWLKALRRRRQVRAFDAEPIGTGQMGSSWLITLRYDGIPGSSRARGYVLGPATEEFLDRCANN